MRLARALLLVVVALPTLGWAGPPATDRVMWESEGFLAAHPDVHHRKRGLWLLEQNKPDEAASAFRQAARFGDKPSQAMLGEMYWTGRGVPEDRALAYAWMDLAAERGYVAFLGKRERYWRELDEAGRAAALRVGVPLYEEYGDAIARPRLDGKLRHAKRQTTGSRLGALTWMQVGVPTPGGLRIWVDGEDYYDRRYWVPERYAALTDEIWSPMPDGQVEVGELDADDGDGADGSR